VTPRATAAPPGGAGAESAGSGMARMLPAGIVSKRFQQLFKGKGATFLSHSDHLVVPARIALNYRSGLDAFCRPSLMTTLPSLCSGWWSGHDKRRSLSKGLKKNAYVWRTRNSWHQELGTTVFGSVTFIPFL
jgi:hypothetical protein